MPSKPVKKDSAWSWLVATGAFIATMLETGMVQSLGVLLPNLRDQFNTETWVIGLAISLAPGFGAVACVIATGLTKITSTRVTVMLFGVISTSGLIIVSLSWSIPVLICGLLLTGFFVGAEGVAISVLPFYFDKYYDISNSIAHIGMAVGVMAMPLFTQCLLFVYEWRSTVLLLSALNAHYVLSGAFLRPAAKTKPKEDEDSFIVDQNRNEQQLKHSKSNLPDTLVRVLDLHLFTNFDFICVFLIHTATGYYFTGWLIYLVPHAQDMGISPYAATALAAVGGAGNVLGSCFSPLLSIRLSSRTLLYISNTLVCISLALDTVMYVKHSYAGLVVASFLMNVGEALDGCSIFKEAYNVVDTAHFTSACTYMFLGNSIGGLCSGFFSGWLFDHSGSYMSSFLVLSIIPLLSLIPLLIKDYTYYLTRRKTQSSYTFLPNNEFIN